MTLTELPGQDSFIYFGSIFHNYNFTFVSGFISSSSFGFQEGRDKCSRCLLLSFCECMTPLLLSFEVGPYNVHFLQFWKLRPRDNCLAGDQVGDSCSPVPYPEIPSPLRCAQGWEGQASCSALAELGKGLATGRTTPEAAPRPVPPVPGAWARCQPDGVRRQTWPSYQPGGAGT